MCGIFGIILPGTTTRPDAEKLEVSKRLLNHRGPDSQAIYAAPGVGFAHTRLSFLDVDARSDQPFWDVSGRYALIYNGQIYNYRQLRADLESRGVVFRTTSDTEVLLLWLLHSPDLADSLAALEGMFAFALYDSHDRSLLLARDRFGMKPLFVHRSATGFMFASEAKAFRPWVAPVADRLMVASYLLKFRGPTQGFTFLDGVQSLSPGAMLVKRVGEAPVETHFARLEGWLSADRIAAYAGQSPTQIVDDMEVLLAASVKAHLLADVPVGAFCSGGVDSSLLMAMAARSHDNLAIFHANVKGRWSEYDAAAELSKHLGLDLKSVDVEEADFITGLPEAIVHYEQPFADRPNCVPMMRVAQLARDSGVKGLLSGEGSDECFLGYPWLGRKKLIDAYYRLGGTLRSAVRRVPGVGDILWPIDSNNGDIVRSLLNRREVDEDNARIAAAVAAVTGTTAHHGWTLEYLHQHLRILLHRNDTMGMASSIESRFPFLDHKVVAAAVNLPGQHKLRFDLGAHDIAHPFTRDKWVVRQVADRYMPKGLSQRRKFGFWTTVFERMQIDPAYFSGSSLGDMLGLTDTQLKTVMGEADRAFQVRLLHLDLWGRLCLNGEDQGASVVRLRDHVTIGAE